MFDGDIEGSCGRGDSTAGRALDYWSGRLRASRDWAWHCVLHCASRRRHGRYRNGRYRHNAQSCLRAGRIRYFAALFFSLWTLDAFVEE